MIGRRAKRAVRRGASLAACSLALVAAIHAPARSAEPPYRAAVVFDADSGAVLHARNANLRVRPASLTKLMTALLVMEHLADADGQRRWSISSRAAGQPASRLGLRAGGGIRIETVLDALLVASANDAALVAAEALAGSEPEFVAKMNAAAVRLGLTRTRFGNASGLPATHHTTARDMAVLARHLWRAFPEHRSRFARSGMNFAGRWVETTNRLIGSYRGARGMKSGFTCRAGFHLVAAASRGGRTLVAVVLGARTREQRDEAVRELLDAGFAGRTETEGLTVDTLGEARGQGGEAPVSASVIARSCLVARGPSGWNIDVGVKRSEQEARALAREFIRARARELRGARAFSIPRYTGVDLHRAVITGLDEKRAREACLDYRAQGGSCVIFGPEAATWQIEDAARIRALAAEYRATLPKSIPLPRRRD